MNVVQLQETLNLSNGELASAVGVAKSTVKYWRRGRQPQGEFRARLEALLETHRPGQALPRSPRIRGPQAE